MGQFKAIPGYPNTAKGEYYMCRTGQGFEDFQIYHVVYTGNDMKEKYRDPKLFAEHLAELLNKDHHNTVEGY